MKIIALSIFAIIIISHSISFGCNASFNFLINFETVNFNNQSNVNNAHYFWNFGDGTGSNFTNPVHRFPDSGDYFITLFALDTISNCSSYFDTWIRVDKIHNENCNLSISDTIFTLNNINNYYYLAVFNTSNCTSIQVANCDGGSGFNYSEAIGQHLGFFTVASFLFSSKLFECFCEAKTKTQPPM